MSEERAYWLAWSRIDRIGPTLLKRLYLHFGSLAIAWKAVPADLGAVGGLGEKSIETIIEQRSRLDPLHLLAEHLERNPQFWTPADPDYPCLLWEIPSPPPLLYYRGVASVAENHGNPVTIAIVGTRYPTAHGRRWTQRIAQTLSQQGFTIVSGMAEGIDSIAHLACLQEGGRTVAVLGSGTDRIYPAHNRSLYENIQQQGLILSEYPVGTPPDRSHFPARNRIIAGLARATLVLEAPEKSGALITARYANEFGRDIYTLPNSPEVMPSRGCLRLLSQGATPIVDLEELLEQLGAIPHLDAPRQLPLLERSLTPEPDCPREWQSIWEVISHDPLPFDEIVQATGQNAGEVSGVLLQLELEGLICQLPGMRYQRKA